MILGMNVLEFILLGWLGCTAFAWLFDFGPEICQEQHIAWREKHPKKEKRDPELTVEMAVGSFDPDTTMKLPRIKHEIQDVFVINKRPHHGRHARG